ncbi:hypothetical protein KLVAMA180M_02285 [Klebsiella variicola subsp. variicola]
MVAVVMLIEFNIAPAGKVQDIVEGGQVVEIEGAAGLIAAAGFAAGVVKLGAKLPFFRQAAGNLDIAFPLVLPRQQFHVRGGAGQALQIDHPLLEVA